MAKCIHKMVVFNKPQLIAAFKNLVNCQCAANIKLGKTIYKIPEIKLSESIEKRNWQIARIVRNIDRIPATVFKEK